MVGILTYLSEGPRIFLSSWKNRIYKRKYEGNAKQICQQIVKDCWNGRFFQTSTNNFKQFWTRDFGWCVSALLKQDYHQEVHQTIRYALNRFKHYNKVTTTITPGGRVYDFPTQAVDSLPWLIHSIKVSKFPYHSYKLFLNNQIRKFFKDVVNEHTGLVDPEKNFSSMKDFALRKSSCYDNCMLSMLARDLSEMKLENPFSKFDYPALIKRHFWNGMYFYDDLSRQDYVAGDANLFPFILGITTDKTMLRSSLQQINKAGLDQPLPLKYTNSRDKVRFVWQELFMRNYESDAIWTHMGPLFIKLAQQVDKDKAKEYKDAYTEMIEKHGNYLEVFSAKGKPFSSIYYYCDSGMLWAANYLTL